MQTDWLFLFEFVLKQKLQFLNQMIRAGGKKFLNLSLWIQQNVKGTSSLLQPQLSALDAAKGNYQDPHWPSLQQSLRDDTMLITDKHCLHI